MTFHRALVRRPSPRLAEGEVTHITRAPLDLSRALQEHEAYVAQLAALGLDIVWLPDAPAHPDGLFVEDVLVSLDGRGVITRPGAPSRRGEINGLEDVVRSLGLACARVEAPALLDGGDVLQTARHVFVGQSTRTNADAVTQLAALTSRAVVAVPVSGALHLKTVITALPDGSLISVAGGAVDAARFQQLGYRVHPAPEPTGADVLCVGQTVVLPANAPQTAALLQTLGFAVKAVDISELQKLESGVTCLSVLV